MTGRFGDGSQLAGSIGDVKRTDTAAEQRRLRFWNRSSDCQYSVYIRLSRSRQPRLSHILARVMLAFLKLSTKGVFLKAIASQHLSDQILQTAVIGFLARWRPSTWARVSDLEADPHVAAVMD